MYNTKKSNGRLGANHSVIKSSLLIAASALGLSLLPLYASAEITQECILEGTVDMRKAEELGQPVYVKFRNARRGTEAGCSLNRRAKSRRVQFTSSPDITDVKTAPHGSKVRYRYIERDNQAGKWELLDVSGA
ncbi:hypothetical protein [Congregibacter litoralis]|uniref:Uncharacterized protein n=1 Tax=Congregibacter litoralis KT71 TaxID=314285 RepID=A4AA42_9GAMM|nr:hypothetical protein [Congregibacter litoralis]EAQ97359.1 hypothetical protein KT71_08264 [Congregibacter litoralis KT71]